MSIKNSINSALHRGVRRGFLMAVLTSLLTGVSGFYFGQWCEQREANARTAKVMEISAGSEDAFDLYVMRFAIEDLRAGRLVDGENKLLRHAQLKVPRVARCRKSPECLFWAGSTIPSDAELVELAEMKERK
ncbi:hypothetical protein [Undibacterium flavidum]|uniref:Uncharacterized protein n=1 Tax=Undibacterium flavidum TaxID=2762297 RepID=A0ABR6YAL2_9BURK|nr:hypothetical protein [Undibacterium flavidum]MBC3873623.1 hypothetical protein [Undibacterium flavidum]